MSTEELSAGPLQFAILNAQLIPRMSPLGPRALHWGLIMAAALRGCQRGALSFHSSTPQQLCPPGARAQIPSLAPAEGLLRFPPHPSHFSFVTWFISHLCAIKQGWRVLSLHSQILPGAQQKYESILFTPACTQTVKKCFFPWIKLIAFKIK